LKTIKINRIDWKKNPTEFETIYNVFLFAIAETRNKNNPDQINNTIETGGITVDIPIITARVVGSVAP
jgi:hypothetical protein